MRCAWDFAQLHIFLLFALSILLGSDVVAAEIRRNHVIRRAVNQHLPGLWNRKLHGVSLMVVTGHVAGRAPKKLDDRVIAKVESVRALEVDNPGERDDALDSAFVSCKAKSKLAASRVTNDQKFLRIEIVLLVVLNEDVVCHTNVGEGGGPSASFVAHAAVLNVGGHELFGGQGRAQVPRMIQAVLGTPKATMNVDDQRMRLLMFVVRGRVP